MVLERIADPIHGGCISHETTPTIAEAVDDLLDQLIVVNARLERRLATYE